MSITCARHRCSAALCWEWCEDGPPDHPGEWVGNPKEEDDQQLFSWNYWNRVQALAFPASFRFRAIRADGSTFDVETDMIPLTFGGHTVAYHFVRRVGA